ncbi:MAG: universal stress protein [Acidimicrobiales bacterium]
MFQRLLVAIDDTERSDITLSFATAVAKERGAVVHLFYVNEFAVGTGGMPLHTNEEAVALLTRAAEQLRAEGIRVTGSARRASYRQVPQRIATAADEFGADAIVLGSRRRNRCIRLFSGRVRERTVRLTSLPVIMAPAPLDIPVGARLAAADVMSKAGNRPRSVST